MRQPMLAATIEDKHLDKVAKMMPLDLSIKLDGIRSVAKDMAALTRSMKLVPNGFVQKFFRDHHNMLTGLDGELMVPGNFQSVSSAIMSRDGEPDFTYNVFDTWVNPERPFWRRLQDAACIEGFHPRVKLVRQTRVETLDEFLAYEEWALDEDHEGIMARRPDGIYKYGRSTLNEGYLMKRKPFESDEAVIIGFEEAMANTNEVKKDERGYTKRSHAKAGKVPKGTLGVIIAKHKAFGEIRIGGGKGWTDKLRQEIWENQEKYLGKIVSFEYQRVGTKDKPRSGKFRGIRSLLDI